MINRTACAAIAVALAATGASLAAPRAAMPAYVAAAAADPGRGNDRGGDARRHGPELMAFAGVKPGDKVYELIPGWDISPACSAASLARAAGSTPAGPTNTPSWRWATSMTCAPCRASRDGAI